MYFRHNLPYQYPGKCDEHMIPVKHLRDVHLDENYPYLQKSFWFKCQRGLLRICQYTVLPIVMYFRHGLHIHGKEKLRQHRELFRDGLITVSNHVMMWDYICIMVALRPRLGFFPAWKTNLEGPNGPWIRMAGGIPIPTNNLKSMVKFKDAMEEVLDNGDVDSVDRNGCRGGKDGKHQNGRFVVHDVGTGVEHCGTALLE